MKPGASWVLTAGCNSGGHKKTGAGPVFLSGSTLVGGLSVFFLTLLGLALEGVSIQRVEVDRRQHHHGEAPFQNRRIDSFARIWAQDIASERAQCSRQLLRLQAFDLESARLLNLNDKRYFIFQLRRNS